VKRFINTRVVLEIESGKVLSREGFEYDGPCAEAVTATAVTKLVEAWNPGAKTEVYSFSIDPGSIAAFAQEIETLAVTGARVGDPCMVSMEAPGASIAVQGAKVTATDVVSVYLANHQATTAVDSAALVGYLMIYKRAVGS
jgi:hypothetical protein